MKVYKKGRIICYSENPDSSFGDSIWADSISLDYYSKYIAGELDEFTTIFERYLPLGEPIIEAGCGNGRYVLALRKNGYSIEGV